MWTERGSDYDSFEGLFGADLSKMSLEQAKQLIGRTGLDEAFLSTSPTSPWKNNILYEIYIPKGSEAANIAPFSYYGGSGMSYKAVKWKELHIKANMGEAEILINRGYSYQIIDIDKVGEKWIVKMALLDRNNRYFK